MTTEIDQKDSSVAVAEPEQPVADSSTNDAEIADSSTTTPAASVPPPPPVPAPEPPTSTYAIVAPPPEPTPAPPVDSTPKNSYGVVAGPAEPEPTGVGIQVHVKQVEAPVKPPPDRTGLYVGLVVIFGLLAGFAFAGNVSRLVNPPAAAKLTPLTLSAYGLQGQITTKWDDKLDYNLILLPSEIKQRAGFAYAVSNAPRPLSVDVQLKDPLGFVLCSTTVVLKFDPRKAAAQRASQSGSDASGASQDSGLAPTDFARLQLQEIDREHGHDVFQNDLGPDGRIAAISAQGEIPCSQKSFASIASWTFLPNFPTVSEQSDWLNHRIPSGDPESSNLLAAAQDPAKSTTAVRRARRTLATPVSEFYIEGDDAMAGYDPASGIIETRAGKTFAIDRSSSEAGQLKSLDFPINIHYRCDESAACIISPAGAPLLHARIRR